MSCSMISTDDGHDHDTDPDALTPDAILREMGHLMAVVNRKVRPREGVGRPMGVLVHMAMCEDAIADGLATRHLSQVDLADMLGIRPQSISSIMARLEKDGLIERIEDEADRRAHLWTLADAGRAAAAEARMSQKKFAEEAFSVLEDEERVQFASAILKLNASLE